MFIISKIRVHKVALTVTSSDKLMLYFSDKSTYGVDGVTQLASSAGAGS